MFLGGKMEFLFYANKLHKINGYDDIFMYNEDCDEYMHSQNASFCAVAKVNFGGTILNVVVVDSYFKKLSQTAQDFCILHEVGHIKYQHYNNFNAAAVQFSNNNRAMGVLPKEEIEADGYAASIIGVAAARLALLQMVMFKCISIGSKFEILKRCFKIKKVPLG